MVPKAKTNDKMSLKNDGIAQKLSTFSHRFKTRLIIPETIRYNIDHAIMSAFTLYFSMFISPADFLKFAFIDIIVLVSPKIFLQCTFFLEGKSGSTRRWETFKK